METKKDREESKTSLDRPITELELGNRATDALLKAELTNVGQIFELLQKGDEALLAVDGFGRKSLIDLKKRLRSLGYEVPATTE
ncbi:MAG: DNA-directed RNA polymerase subunit alpha C-terminal domain-containing protein [Anaerolineaceae bacterium]|nr:DNA-directed RNA polymerase subunit alpha C-terminal domain-containing protein [Anaerolineaceae bacterium]